ncbi:MAG: hypothetical protein V4495_30150 [Pseudomonadota bacterium]
MKFIDEVGQAWRMLSVQAMSAAIAIQGAWVGMPDDMKSSISPQWVHYLTMGLLALGVVGRLVKQDKVSGS